MKHFKNGSFVLMLPQVKPSFYTCFALNRQNFCENSVLENICELFIIKSIIGFMLDKFEFYWAEALLSLFFMNEFFLG